MINFELFLETRKQVCVQQGSFWEYLTVQYTAQQT